MKFIAVILILAFACIALANRNPPSDEQMRESLKRYFDNVNSHVQDYFNVRKLNLSFKQISQTN